MGLEKLIESDSGFIIQRHLGKPRIRLLCQGIYKEPFGYLSPKYC